MNTKNTILELNKYFITFTPLRHRVTGEFIVMMTDMDGGVSVFNEQVADIIQSLLGWDGNASVHMELVDDELERWYQRPTSRLDATITSQMVKILCRYATIEGNCQDPSFTFDPRDYNTIDGPFLFMDYGFNYSGAKG